ncbi:globin domain-containing protein [Streptomyces sp. CB03238]|uniref:globin domain-containing protein n=1 Tax=Streptomyces sp. CB03238 TaxID=1907777 RepID=UPI000A11EA8C|nr:globin domain-containing protein [Streptomyces sp. CB03238]ORT57741.1 flavohemoprotein [Streptomyces sp. CB03238]
MNAPTTTSADNGTSGDNGGGSGWFTPRKPVTDRPAESEAAHADGHPGREAGAGQAPEGHQERIAGARRPLTSIRMVGTGAARMAEPEAGAAPASRTPEAETRAPSTVPWPDGSQRPVRERQAERPMAPEPPHASADPVHAPEPQDAPYDAPTGQVDDARHPDGAGYPSRSEHAEEAHHVDEAHHSDHLDSARHHGRAAHPDGPHARPDGPDAHPGSPEEQPSPEAVADAVAAESGSPDAIRVRRTLAEVGPVSDKVTSYFYALLFTRNPELRGLFPAAMEAQRDRLLKALLTAAEHMDNAAVLTEYLQHLGRGHRKYGTEASHYPAVGEALIGALSRYATTTWDEETEAAWVRTYTTISQIMIDAAAENERHAPAWWHAEVVSHDLRTPDIAVITVRPDQPYPFLAGQYTSLETPWWPRIWRHYSFASAPRSDGLLSFHVKAVPAGWVSNALVHHARPGDVLRLGPPAGSMTVDHTTDNGLLCLGGGTGIAPIKALVEDVAEHGARRPVEVFYGARTDHDLYDIDTMLRLQQSHPWLEVRAIIDGKTQLPDVVREYGPWNEYDAYLSGPVGMIRSGVDALRGVGVPYERIRHDSLEELVAAGD